MPKRRIKNDALRAPTKVQWGSAPERPFDPSAAVQIDRKEHPTTEFRTVADLLEARMKAMFDGLQEAQKRDVANKTLGSELTARGIDRIAHRSTVSLEAENPADAMQASSDDGGPMQIGQDAKYLLARAVELFGMDLTRRAAVFAEWARRVRVRREHLIRAHRTDASLDFLLDCFPERDDPKYLMPIRRGRRNGKSKGKARPGVGASSSSASSAADTARDGEGTGDSDMGGSSSGSDADDEEEEEEEQHVEHGASGAGQDSAAARKGGGSSAAPVTASSKNSSKNSSRNSSRNSTTQDGPSTMSAPGTAALPPGSGSSQIALSGPSGAAAGSLAGSRNSAHVGAGGSKEEGRKVKRARVDGTAAAGASARGSGRAALVSGGRSSGFGGSKPEAGLIEVQSTKATHGASSKVGASGGIEVEEDSSDDGD